MCVCVFMGCNICIYVQGCANLSLRHSSVSETIQYDMKPRTLLYGVWSLKHFSITVKPRPLHLGTIMRIIRTASVSKGDRDQMRESSHVNDRSVASADECKIHTSPELLHCSEAAPPCFPDDSV